MKRIPPLSKWEVSYASHENRAGQKLRIPYAWTWTASRQRSSSETPQRQVTYYIAGEPDGRAPFVVTTYAGSGLGQSIGVFATKEAAHKAVAERYMRAFHPGRKSDRRAEAAWKKQRYTKPFDPDEFIHDVAKETAVVERQKKLHARLAAARKSNPGSTRWVKAGTAAMPHYTWRTKSGERYVIYPELKAGVPMRGWWRVVNSLLAMDLEIRLATHVKGLATAKKVAERHYASMKLARGIS